jgi:transcriptional regulator of NAD metabolism
MDGNTRREKIIEAIRESVDPISGSALAKLFKVSRQVIVQDIALLRASDYDIISTTKGYLLYQAKESTIQQVFYVRHSTDDIEDELCTIVDNGGKIMDVHVVHEIYGQIVTELIIRNRNDVYDFVNKVKEKKIVPLKELTAGTHRHTIEADSKEILDKIAEALRRKNYLIEE